MTRAMERLIVSGSVDRSSERDERTPIGWVLERLALGEELDRADAAGPVEVERGNAGVVLRIDRFVPADGDVAPLRRPRRRARATRRGSSCSSRARARTSRRPRPGCASSSRSPRPRSRRVARLSYSAIALHDRCGYRYYAERVVGMRPAPWEAACGGETARRACIRPRSATRCTGCSSSSTWRHPAPPDEADLEERVRGWYPAVSDDELSRIGELVRVVHRLGARGPDRRRSTASGPSARSPSSSTACS